MILNKMTNSFVDWHDVNRDSWNYINKEKHFNLIVFELSKVPNFDEPRFQYLGEKLEERKNEISRRQLKMLRQLHSLGQNFGISLRVRKDGNRLRLFVVIRVSNDNLINENHADSIAQTIENLFPHEYNLQRIKKEQNNEIWNLATNISWAKKVDEIFKQEDQFPANSIPFFYVSNLWQPLNNDMDGVCRAIVKSPFNTMIDITFVPTEFCNNERDWIDMIVKRLKEAQMGESLYSEDRKLLKKFEPMPILRAPTENYENLVKRYGQSRVCLSSYRVFSSGDTFTTTHALISASTKSTPQIKSYNENDKHFKHIIASATCVDIAPSIHTDFWEGDPESIPFRAQRLHRLVDIEELSSFWKFPIPSTAVFPGFELDTGLGTNKKALSKNAISIELGTFADDPAKSNMKALFDRQQLAKHGLIVGVPGSGKTTATFNILHQLWCHEKEEDRIPFIVLEPAKTEYRALKEIDRFKEDMLIFTLGDERISPFRFNPLEVLPGIPVESHISRLNACFMGAFNLFDPLPMLLDKAIRQTYISKGWYDDSVGGESGLETPTLSDLCREAKIVAETSGYSGEAGGNIKAALINRLESLCRGSKGRMMDTKTSVSFDELMNRPIIMELDSLNEEEKALLMMFILTFVYEYCKIRRKSGSPLKHVLVVEEAHNMIGRGDRGKGGDSANPKDHSIKLFVRMLAEMRALGQGILIADQLPTAIATEAIKQTNLKILMRLTAKDDREEIGNTMCWLWLNLAVKFTNICGSLIPNQ